MPSRAVSQGEMRWGPRTCGEAGREPVTQLAGWGSAEELLVSWGAGLAAEGADRCILGAHSLLKDYKRFMPSYLPERLADFKEGSSGDVGCLYLGTQMSGWLWDSLNH